VTPTPSLRLDLEDVLDGYDAMSRAGRDLTAVWREVTPLVRRDQSEHARLQEGTEGRWPKLAASTVAQRRAAKARGRKSRPVRNALGKLPRSVVVRYNRQVLKIESKVPWSGVHQDGGSVGRGATVPAREHVYFSAQALDRIVERLAQHIAEAF